MQGELPDCGRHTLDWQFAVARTGGHAHGLRRDPDRQPAFLAGGRRDRRELNRASRCRFKCLQGRFQVFDDASREPLSGQRYRVTTIEGTPFEGETDADGYTAWTEAQSPERCPH